MFNDTEEGKTRISSEEATEDEPCECDHRLSMHDVRGKCRCCDCWLYLPASLMPKQKKRKNAQMP